MPINIDQSNIVGEYIAQLDGTKSRCKLVTIITKRSNHIPTLTGGYGQNDLHRFYKHHFIPKSPKDMRNIPISRTVGANIETRDVAPVRFVPLYGTQGWEQQ